MSLSRTDPTVPHEGDESPFQNPESMDLQSLSSMTAGERRKETEGKSFRDEAEPSQLQNQSFDVLSKEPQGSSSLDSISPSESQGVMQMLSLVGSHFLEADRLGLTGVDGDGEGDGGAGDEPRQFAQGEVAEEDPSERESSRKSQSRGNPAGQELRIGEQAQMTQGRQVGAGKAIPISFDQRTRTLADMIDDQATPRGGATPITASLAGMPARSQPFSSRRMHFSDLDERTYDANPRTYPREDSSTSDSREVDDQALQSSITSDSSHGESSSDNGSRNGSAQLLEESVASLSAALSEEGESLSNSEQQTETNLPNQSRRAQLSSKLRSLFDLEEEEELISSHSCWIFRSVLLQGYLYLTTSHICFYAYLPSREDRVLKASWIGKRTQRTRRFSKHWAILKGSALSWYENERDPYFPQGHIDLRHAFNCDPSPENETQFTIGTSRRRFIFNVDSQLNRDDWVKVVRKALLRSHNEGESVRISIPLETIIDLDTTSSSSLSSISNQSHSASSGSSDPVQSDMVCLKVVDDQTDDFAVDEYYFLHFADQDGFLEKLRNGMSEMLAKEGNLADSNLTTRTKGSRSGVVDTTTGSKASRLSASDETSSNQQAGISAAALGTNDDPKEGSSGGAELQPAESRSIQQEDISLSPEALTSLSESISSAHPIPYPSTTQEPSNLGTTYPPSPAADFPPSSFSRFQKDSQNTWAVPRWMRETSERILGGKTLVKLPFPRRRVIEAWSSLSTKEGARGNGGPSGKEVGEAEGPASRGFDLDESGHLAFSVVDVEETAPALEKEELVEKHFRECFAVPQEEKLLAHLSASLYRVLPSSGRLFISASYLCFRSSRLASKTVGRTLMMVPMRDIISVAKHRAFRFGQHGLVVIVRGHEEIFMEFSSPQRRDQCVSLVEKQLEIERKAAAVRLTGSGAPNSVGQGPEVEKDTALILRDLGERLDSVNDSLSSPSRSINSSPASEGKENLKPLHSSSSSSFLSFKPKRPLHFTALTIGSRGDVQPYIALAKGLIKEGHKVRIATHAEFKDWIEGHGIEFREVGGDPAELMRICVENGTFTISFLREGVTRFRGWLDDLLLSCWAACQGTDVIIESPSAIAGIHVAEALSIPYFRAFTMLWSRTRAYPHAFAVPGSKAGGNYNYMSYVIFDQVFWRASAGQINSWRKECLGLKATNIDELGQHKVPFIYNFSPSLVPRPLDWYEWIHVTGFWFLDNPDNSTTKSWSPSPELLSFIEKSKSDGKKLVYIGWGSIVVPDAAAMTRTVVEAVKKSGVRAILSKGWSDRLSSKEKNNQSSTASATGSLEEEPDIFQVNSIPHDWLFPQVNAACHHGGAGTLGASLRAGIPTIIKPYFGDQFFWGSQVESLGVGSCLKKFNVETLSQALVESTQNEKQIEKAKNIGLMIRNENGVEEAIKCIYRDLDYATSLIKTNTRIRPREQSVKVKSPSGTIKRKEEKVGEGFGAKQEESENLDQSGKDDEVGGSSSGVGPVKPYEAEQDSEQDPMSGSGQFSSSDGWSVVSEEESAEAKMAQGH